MSIVLNAPKIKHIENCPTKNWSLEQRLMGYAIMHVDEMMTNCASEVCRNEVRASNEVA